MFLPELSQHSKRALDGGPSVCLSVQITPITLHVVHMQGAWLIVTVLQHFTHYISGWILCRLAVSFLTCVNVITAIQTWCFTQLKAWFVELSWPEATYTKTTSHLTCLCQTNTARYVVAPCGITGLVMLLWGTINFCCSQLRICEINWHMETSTNMQTWRQQLGNLLTPKRVFL